MNQSRELGVRSGYFDPVSGPNDMDAGTWALAGGLHDRGKRVVGDVGLRSRRGQQLVVRVLDVGQPIDVQLEDVAGLLDADAVARAQVLVYPDPVSDGRPTSGRLCGHVRGTLHSMAAAIRSWPLPTITSASEQVEKSDRFAGVHAR